MENHEDPSEDIPDLPQHGVDGPHGVPADGDPLAFETLSDGIARQPSDHLIDPRQTPEHFELQVEQALYELSDTLSATLTASIHASLDAKSSDIVDPPRPLDPEVPFSVEQFNEPVSPEEAGQAYAILHERVQRSYGNHHHLMQRAVTSFNAVDGSFTCGWGVALEQSDERGYADIMVRTFDEIELTFITPDGTLSSYMYAPEEREGRKIMRRHPVSIAHNAHMLRGAIPYQDLDRTVKEKLAENAQFRQQMGELTNSEDPVVGPAEAAFLNSLIGTALPMGDRHDEGQLIIASQRRAVGSVPPEPLLAAVAARETERIAAMYAFLHGDEPNTRTYEHEVSDATGTNKYRVERVVSTHAQPAGDRPATLSAITAYTMPSPLVAERYPQEKLLVREYTYEQRTTLSAAGNKLIFKDTTVVSGSEGDVTHTLRSDHTEYDIADTTEVVLFLRLLYNPY